MGGITMKFNDVNGRILKSLNSYLVVAFVSAFSVLLIIPMWWAYGVLLPEEGGHGAHGAGEMPSASEFEEKTASFIKEHRLPDGSVRAENGKTIYVMAIQYTFRPKTIRLTAGEQYDLRMLSTDVVHAFSVQMAGTSYNAVVMPNMVTALKLKPTKPGTYRVFCNEYCGIGHDYMYFSIIVEEARDADSTIKKDHGHGAH
jgi:heme/copper-type cytochrome/quinol oxidase subunit 2